MTVALSAPIIVPTGEWFTSLRPTTRDQVLELVNNEGYPLDDIKDFVEQYGEEAFREGHYVTWCEITEKLNVSNEAVIAFIKAYGIGELPRFEDAWVGEYSSPEVFAREHITSLYAEAYDILISAGAVVDWAASWKCDLRHRFIWENGYVFNRDY